jgi:hypothetical protein
MSVLSILANTLGGAKSLARFQPIDPSTSQPAVDNNGNPILGDMVQETNSAATLAAIQALLTEDAGLATASGQTSSLTQVIASSTALGTPADAVWSGTGSSSIVAALKAIWTALTGTVKTQLQAGTAAIGSVSVSNGSVGADFSSNANHTALPAAVGATIGTSTYGGSGPFAAYVLVASAAANASRANIDVENVSGSQVVVVRDDGTAAAGSAPVNASWFLLAGGGTGPSQGGAWSSTTFRGRVQLWMASVPTYSPSVFGD